MFRASMTSTDKVTQAIYAVWARIQKELGVPDLDLFLTHDHNSGCATNWNDQPLVIRMNLRESGPLQSLPLEADENRTPEDVLLHLLHLGAHAGAPNFAEMSRPSEGRGSEGRCHGRSFAYAAQALGLKTAKRGDPKWSAATGFAIDFDLYADPSCSNSSPNSRFHVGGVRRKPPDVQQAVNITPDRGVRAPQRSRRPAAGADRRRHRRLAGPG